MNKPLLIYDGDCTFCRYWITRWKCVTSGKIDFEAYQSAAERFPNISLDQFKTSVQFITTDGAVYSAAEAVFRALGEGRKTFFWIFVYQSLPGFGFLSEVLYRIVARHRSFFSKITGVLWGSDPSPSRFILSSWFFRRGLALIYLMAFGSLIFQIQGLIGIDGILPAADYLNNVSNQFGRQKYWLVPSMFWIDASNGFLVVACWTGIASSLLLFIGYVPVFFFALNWMMYLSLVSVGGNFLRFQWDTLLLETGFLAIFLSPLTKRDRFKTYAPPVLITILLRWLLFRLMFSSGLVKLLSGDVSWSRLEALNFHYQTQPLPTWVAWYVHQLPAWVDRYSVIGLFFIELFIPFSLFLPRRPRAVGAFFLLALQILIMLTGNYGFFNWLTIILILLVIEDCQWPFRRISKMTDDKEAVSVLSAQLPKWIIAPVFSLILLLSAHMFAVQNFRWHWPKPLSVTAQLAAPFSLVNPYGLFAAMTTSRKEIFIQGSNDSSSWLTYEFKYKPGNPKNRPLFIAPYQPRLDWQMWFAALGHYQQNPWFISFLTQLLKGAPDVLSLLKRNPFPDSPPRFIRAVSYDYRFSRFDDGQRNGFWWVVDGGEIYCPSVSLKQSDEK